MVKKAFLAVFFSLILLASIFLAQVVQSGCVTYAQARAQGIQGTDAELKSKGFCAGESEPVTTKTTPAAAETGLSGKSVEEMNNIRIQLSNTLYEQMIDYDRSMFDSAMKPVWDMRVKELDDSLKRLNSCDDSCAGLKFQRGGTGQACVQPCYDRAEAEGKKVLQEIDRLEKAAYVNDITRLRAALAGKTPEIPQVKGELPKGPEHDTRTGKGLTPQGLIAPSLGGYLGNAYVQRADGTKVIPGKELYLKVDDKVITGEESKVNIIFGNAGKMNLGPNTELRVGSALLDQYYLAKGTLKTKLDWTAGAKLRIDTMNAKIFNTGTEFVVEYNETTNTTTVFLYEGGLEIDSATQTINLTAGNYCMIGPDGTITSGQLASDDWNALSDRFYEDVSSDQIFKVYAWLTFAVLVVSALVVVLVMRREKAKQHKKAEHGKNLGGLSILFGILGILGCLFPIIGFPLSFTSTTLARIQKLRSPTTSAKIGQIIGGIGAVLNCMTFIAFFVYLGII
ncbi:MAG: FecR family protein [Nanoarchaeota archaeon]|nr:FecR family protein [Nanoarchaeota archaeon]